MGIKLKIILFVAGIIFTLVIIGSIRKSTIRPSSALLWAAISIFLLSIPVLEPFYKWISNAIFGVEDARHVIYLFIIAFLLVYLFYLTIKTSRISDQVQGLISHMAILENTIKKLSCKTTDKT
jgi:hypothetical protein